MLRNQQCQSLVIPFCLEVQASACFFRADAHAPGTRQERVKARVVPPHVSLVIYQPLVVFVLTPTHQRRIEAYTAVPHEYIGFRIPHQCGCMVRPEEHRQEYCSRGASKTIAHQRSMIASLRTTTNSSLTESCKQSPASPAESLRQWFREEEKPN